MATLYSSKPIKVSVSGTGVVAGQKAKVINRTTGETHPTATSLSADKRLVFDCAEFPSGYVDGDVLEASVFGPAYGKVLITLSGSKSQSDTLSATAESGTLPKGGN